MEKSTEINSLIFIGTGLMLTFGCVTIILALFYQGKISRVKRMEAELMLKVSLESEKKERSRIASDIHDGISGDLNSIRNYLAILSREDISPRQENIYMQIKESIESAIENARQVSYRLMPPLLETFGLSAALQDYFSMMSKMTGLHFAVVGTCGISDLDSGESYEVYRIIQELTTNMIKYGEISTCLVSFENKGEIFISDDGKQFSLQENSNAVTGTGIKNIFSRAKAIGARIVEQRVSGNNDIIIYLKQPIC